MCLCMCQNVLESHCGNVKAKWVDEHGNEKIGCVYSKEEPAMATIEYMRRHPKPKPDWHPAIVEGHFGIDFESLDRIIENLEKGKISRVPPAVDEKLQIAEQLFITHGAKGESSAKSDVKAHYHALAGHVKDARSIFANVAETMDLHKPERQARALKVARQLLRAAIAGLHEPPAGAIGMDPHATPIRRGDVA